ncbi:NTP transferase domain-containing protein [Microbacterium sp. LWO13-1.2]|uniref:molybdenum cofactor guanylyltransferase n=1 Tax=Microbacterium sp. LWO13-1.2 TaxID=3135262 RepID=UPI003138BD5B
MTASAPESAAIVLAGGRATRLDAADKASLVVDGTALVDHVFAAVRGCTPIIAVGPDSLSRPGIRVVREDPPFGGPVAAISAALHALDGVDVVETWLLACDLPRAQDLVALLAAVAIPDDADAVIAVDADGREQWLAGRYRLNALRRAAAALPKVAGVSMRSLIAPLTLHTVDDAGTALDLDTWSAIDDYRNSRKDHHV